MKRLKSALLAALMLSATFAPPAQSARLVCSAVGAAASGATDPALSLNLWYLYIRLGCDQ
ncbi:MAG TPA: hypothetical protein PLJ16_07380 [Casimicrobium huifangae]|jgi:hypothetical protein|uniref:hypothetical protein n=1 Tax=Casimicrobium huifangae TaxID=2591109 RepID=UPI0012EB5E40|nr:hypothetical protein [Casimicrobium huifangae]HOB02336.1 hypothetical protein [Casimicrobium huifangae]HQA35052.1 hypothetical protein [Casimicrobium huifangae]HQD65031.1 hypothetical protein [Casimicrobium huifangae]